MKLKRVLLTALLSAAMVLNFMPAAVFAEEEQETDTLSITGRVQNTMQVTSTR